MAQPLVFDPTSRLIVEQPIQDPNSPNPNSLVLTNEIGVLPPEISNYVEQVVTTEPLPAGTWVNIYTVSGLKRARKANASDQSKTAHGYVARDTPISQTALVYFTGPNRNVNTTISGLTSADIGKPVYLSTTNPGHVQKTLPTAPGHAKQFIGYVTDVGAIRSVVVTKIVDQAGNIPTQTGQAGKVLTTDGSNLGWSPMTPIPTVVGNSGRVLSNNGVTTNWMDLPTTPPVGVAGTVLTSNGSTSQWSTPPGFANPMTAAGDLIVGGTSGTPIRLERGDYRNVLGVLDNGTLGWTPRSVPSAVGNSGKILSSDGSVTVWIDAPVGLPIQTGNAGKILTTNGTTASWATWSLQKAYEHGSGVITVNSSSPITIKAGTATEQNLLEGHSDTGALTSFVTSSGKGYFETLTLQSKTTLTTAATVARSLQFPDRAGNVALEDATSLKAMLPTLAGNNGKLLSTDGTDLIWQTVAQSVVANQAGNAGKYLTTDGSVTSWVTVPALLPTQTGNSGMFLTTDGTNASWVSVAGLSMPIQTGNAGKFLTTDGTTTSWSQVFPTQTGNAGKFLTTDGTTVSWSDPTTKYLPTETLTGGTWLAGQPIYRTVVYAASLTKGTDTSLAHGISGIVTFTNIVGVADNGTTAYKLGGADHYCHANRTHILYFVPSGWTGALVGNFILEYTKS